MRGRLWLIVSLVLNLVLAGLLWHYRTHTPLTRTPTVVLTTNTPTTIVRTNTVIRRQNFVWSDIESDDYATFIANLRLIGCPEITIRDIIVADVNQLFAKRHATEVVTPQHQWWRPTPDAAVAREAVAAAAAIEKERRDLLTQLLGPDWESADYPFPSAYALSQLDGELLGSLAPEVKAAVHEVERESQERLRGYLAKVADEAEPADPAILAQLQLEQRQALTQLLTQAELEEYLLRYTDTSRELRSSLSGIDLTPEEFRQLFQSLDTIAQQRKSALADSSLEAPDPESLDLQIATTMQEVLGEDRYEAYQLSQDPLYQQARSLMDQSETSEDQVVPLAAILRLTQEEEDRIRTDSTLTSEERLDQLQATREAQRDSLRQLLGEEAFNRYLEKQADVWENP